MFHHCDKPLTVLREFVRFSALRRGAALSLLLTTAMLAALVEPVHADERRPRRTKPAASSSVHAAGGLLDDDSQRRPQLISVLTGYHYGTFGYYGAPLFVGARYYLPILPNGFIPALNDEFGIEAGADLIFTFLEDRYSNGYYYYRYTGAYDDGKSVMFALGIPVAAVWDFHILPKLDVYAKVGLTVGFKTKAWDDYRYSYYHYDGDSNGWADLISQVGVRFRISDKLYLRGELGYPSIAVGLGLAL